MQPIRRWRLSHMRPAAWIVIAAIAVGTALRVVGLSWGLPIELHTDEWVIVTGALDLAQRNSFEPSLFFRPDHVEIQLSFLAYTAYALVIAHSPVEVAYAADPGTFLFISRAITASFGIVMIVLAAAIGRRISPATGAIAAVIVAIYPPFVEHSHYATPDVPLTTMFMVVILAGMHYLAKPGYASLLVASAATSISIAIKYPGAIATLMIATVIVIAAMRDRAYGRIVAHGLTAVVAVIGFLFLISPVLFTNFHAVVAAITQESRTTHAGADGLDWGGNLTYYASGFVFTAGVILTLFAAVGLVAIVRRRMISAIPLLLGAVMWLLLSAVALHWERWGVPMALTPVFLASIGLTVAWEAAGRQARIRAWRRPTAIVLVAVAGTNLVVNAMAVDARLLAPDTRVVSAQTVERLGLTPDNTLYEGYTALLPASPWAIFDDTTVRSGVLVPTDPRRVWVMVSSCMYDRYLSDPKYATEQAFYARLDDDLAKEASFRAVPNVERSPLELLSIVRAGAAIKDFATGGWSGCDIRIYRVPQ